MNSFDNVSVKIIDLRGKQVLSTRIITTQHSFDVSALSKGVYFVEVVNENEKEVKRFVKM